MTELYFYPHNYLRARHLETIKYRRTFGGKKYVAKNADQFEYKTVKNVEKDKALLPIRRSIFKLIPLLNIRYYSRGNNHSVVYCFGGLVINRKFIIELDNPFVLCFYNVKFFHFFRWFFKRILLSERCQKIICISEACANSCVLYFGETIRSKIEVQYPLFKPGKVNYSHKFKLNSRRPQKTHLLFQGTQFYLKGGVALLQAFEIVWNKNYLVDLTLVTHSDAEMRNIIGLRNDVSWIDSDMCREAFFDRFLSKTDIFILPTFGESFGMSAFEAVNFGIPVITNRIYALPEFVNHKKNGFLLDPPFNVWKGYEPSEYFGKDDVLYQDAKLCTPKEYVHDLANAIIWCIENLSNLNEQSQNLGRCWRGRL